MPWQYENPAGTSGGGGGLSNVVDDTTPQLGGMLDVNGFSIGDGLLELLSFIETASAVNEITVRNAATGGSPSVIATGDDANIDLTIDGKGSGTVKITSSDLNVTGDIIVSGTVDGRDIASDGSKLDGVESLADVTDSVNVAAAGAVMDSDFSGAEGFMRKTGAGSYQVIKSNLNASVAPTINNDSGGSYAIGSRWIDTASDKEYVCLDASVGAAVWTETTGAGSGSITIGATVQGSAVNNAILYVDGSGNLGNTTNFQWDSGVIITTPTISDIGLTLNATATQSADILQVVVDSAQTATIDNIGNFTNSRGAIGNEYFGTGAGAITPTGDDNTGIGYQALNICSLGQDNTAVGSYAGLVIDSGLRNTIIGKSSGEDLTSGDDNTLVGYLAGADITVALNNTVVGAHAFRNSILGANNVSIGMESLYTISGENANCAVGMRAGKFMSSGSYNVIVGTGSAENKTGGNNNVIVGFQSGYNASTAAGCILIGYQAGYNNTSSNKLFIANSNTATPLIGGDFSTSTITINGTQTITNANHDGLTIESTGTGSRAGLVCDNDASVQFQLFVGGSLHGLYPSEAALVLDDGVPFTVGHASTTPRLYISTTGTIGIGTKAIPTANSEDMLIFKSKSTDPTMNTNTSGLYGKSDAGNVRMHAIDEDGTTKYLTGACGEIKVEENSTATVISASSTDFSNAVQVVIFDTDGISRGTTVSHTNDDIAISEPGFYSVKSDISFSGAASDTISFAIFKNNGATKLTTRASKTLATTNTYHISISGLADLSTNDTIELWVQNETTTNNIVVESATLNVVKI